MSYEVRDLEPETRPNPAPHAPVAVSHAEMLRILNLAVDQAVSRARDMTAAMSVDILADVEKRLAGLEAPKPKIMAVSIDKEVRRLQKAAVPYLGRMIIMAKTGKNILLIGPAGCGKTFAAHQLAEALALPFAHVCFTAGASETWLFGRQTPNGFIEAPFVRLYREGGVFLGDEFDAADENMALSINTALANGHLFNPINGETYVKHKNFVFVACANTLGKGADHVYTGRNRLDGATLNRFSCSKIAVDYDADIERQLCPEKSLLKALTHARSQLKVKKSDEIISTRTIQDACDLYLAGIPALELFESITLGWPSDLVKACGLDQYTEPTAQTQTPPPVPMQDPKPVSIPREEASTESHEEKLAALKARLAASAHR